MNLMPQDVRRAAIHEMHRQAIHALTEMREHVGGYEWALAATQAHTALALVRDIAQMVEEARRTSQ